MNLAPVLLTFIALDSKFAAKILMDFRTVCFPLEQTLAAQQTTILLLHQEQTVKMAPKTILLKFATFMPRVGALNWHLKTLIVPKKVLRHVLLQHCAVSISAMAPLMMKKTLLLYLHFTARDNCIVRKPILATT
jgi:hypothetical protein